MTELETFVLGLLLASFQQAFVGLPDVFNFWVNYVFDWYDHTQLFYWKFMSHTWGQA